MNIIADFNCITGENPLWNKEERCLYWTDIPQGKLFCWDSQTNKTTLVYDDRPVGGFTFEKDGGLLLFQERGQVQLLKNHNLTTILAENTDLVASRFNDVFALDNGAVLCGTMPDSNNESFLYYLDRTRELKLVLNNLKLANGMAYTPNNNYIYLADTRDFLIYILELDSNGELLSKKLFIDFHKEPGRPDGITVDSRGNLWVAETGAGQIVSFSPEAKVLTRLKLPFLKPTSLAFGGVNLDTLYVTSQSNDTPAEAIDGKTIALSPQIKLELQTGRVEYYSMIQ